jgi:peptide/nickel transport system substrate-binding protein
MRKRNTWIIALMLILSLVAAACGGGDDDTDTGQGDGDTGGAEKGGILMHESVEFSFTGGFDPVGEYLGEAWGVMSNLGLRNLVSYEHTAGAAGNEIVADLATEVPEPSGDGT